MNQVKPASAHGQQDTHLAAPPAAASPAGAAGGGRLDGLELRGRRSAARAALGRRVAAVLAYLALVLFLGGDGGAMPKQVVGLLFGAVAGVMVYISLDELLPTSRAYGKGHDSLLGLLAGMAVMAVSLLMMK